VQDILREEEIHDKISCVTTDLSVDDMEDEGIPDSEIKKFLPKVAKEKGIKPMNIESWVDAVESKFSDIGIDSVSALRTGILLLSRRLNTRGVSVLHTRTLVEIAKVGEQEACEMKLEVERLSRELAIAQTEDRISNDAEEKTEDWTKGCDDTAFHVATKVKMSKFGLNTLLGDSGASSHYVNIDVGMFDVQVINEPIKVGDGRCMTAGTPH
jgi:hypothetical protein